MADPSQLELLPSTDPQTMLSKEMDLLQIRTRIRSTSLENMVCAVEAAAVCRPTLKLCSSQPTPAAEQQQDPVVATCTPRTALEQAKALTVSLGHGIPDIDKLLGLTQQETVRGRSLSVSNDVEMLAQSGRVNPAIHRLIANLSNSCPQTRARSVSAPTPASTPTTGIPKLTPKTPTLATSALVTAKPEADLFDSSEPKKETRGTLVSSAAEPVSTPRSALVQARAVARTLRHGLPSKGGIEKLIQLQNPEWSEGMSPESKEENANVECTLKEKARAPETVSINEAENEAKEQTSESKEQFEGLVTRICAFKYGFIKSEQYENLFFHFSELSDDAKAFVETGCKVSFHVQANLWTQDKKKKAVRIKVVSSPAENAFKNLKGSVQCDIGPRGFCFIDHMGTGATYLFHVDNLSINQTSERCGNTVAAGHKVIFDAEWNHTYRPPKPFATNVRIVPGQTKLDTAAAALAAAPSTPRKHEGSTPRGWGSPRCSTPKSSAPCGLRRGKENERRCLNRSQSLSDSSTWKRGLQALNDEERFSCSSPRGFQFAEVFSPRATEDELATCHSPRSGRISKAGPRRSAKDTMAPSIPGDNISPLNAASQRSIRDRASALKSKKPVARWSRTESSSASDNKEAFGEDKPKPARTADNVCLTTRSSACRFGRRCTAKNCWFEHSEGRDCDERKNNGSKQRKHAGRQGGTHQRRVRVCP